MASLQDLSTRQSPGSPGACARTGRLCMLPQNEVQGSFHQLECYPEININIDATNSASIAGSSLASRSSDSWRNVMVTVDEDDLKRVIRTFFENGFTEALNEARNIQSPGGQNPIAQLAEYTFQALEMLKRLKIRLFPHLKEQGIASLAKHSETRDWIRSYIRSIAWHPNCFKIAVAGLDDIVRVYTDEPMAMPQLKCNCQVWITSMAWRPYTAAELAVGCQRGICLWTLDNSAHISRNTAQFVFLKHSKHFPITSLQWNTDGTLLASASIGDADIILWNVDKMQNTALKRVGPPCCLLKWSPNGSRLFSSTVSNVFRVWSCEKQWQPERWTITQGSIQSACWSPCGGILLFVTSDEPMLYRLQFHEVQIFQKQAVNKLALPIADLTKVCIEGQQVGGLPQSLAWDPNGLYLAIIFKDSPCVTIFTTGIQKFNLSISPACFISGQGAEHASYICFQSKNRQNLNSVLTIGWSSGRIQYFPFNM